MKKQVVLLVAGAFFVSACTTTNPYTGETQTSKTGIGAGLGALVGGIGGAIAGGRNSVLIGAGVGALVGGGIGSYMDKQESDLRERLRDSGVSVTRVGDDIILNMPGNVTFSSNRTELKPDFFEVLNSVSLVLNEYNRSIIDIEGHTDSDGSDQYNLDLSARRARSVADYLSSQSVDPRRFKVTGIGEREPIASNKTARGKAQNRRVEIKIVPLTS